MSIYVHEVEATVTNAPNPTDLGSITPQQLEAIVDAVIREMEKRKRQSASLKAESSITGSNRPPSVGT